MGIEEISESATGVGAERLTHIGDYECIHHRLEELARNQPDSIAFSQKSTNYNFSDCNGLANHVARELTRQTPGCEGLIAVWSADPALQLILAFGVWKAGLSAVILDTRDSKNRIRWILDHAGVGAVVADDGSVQQASQVVAGTKVLQIEPRDIDATAPEPDFAPDTPALIIYTSGSEGQPKGVVRSHHGMLQQCRYHGLDLELNSEDRVAQLYPLNFASGMKHALTTLLHGSPLCFYDVSSEGLKPFYDWFRREGITVVPSPVAFFRRVLHHAPDSNDLVNCRSVVLGGERVFKRDVDLFRKVFPGDCKLFVTYGATETGAIARYVIRGDTPITDPLPVGTCIGDKEVKIFSPRLRELPVGEAGEIAVLDKELPPGYWKDPEATERKYRLSPGNDGRRMYMTGDFGRIGKDGLLYLLGRNDNQLKVRGYRVDLSEIETALNSDKNIVHAVVATTEESSGESKVIAYVALSGEPENQQELTRELKKTTAANLPAYMVPDEFVILDVIPTTLRGKIDREALHAVPSPAERIEEEAPTETEQKVIEVWRKVFQLDDVSLEEDLLDLGVKSLPAMEMCLVLGKMFSIEVPYAQLTLSSTPRQLASYIDSKLAKK